MKRDATIYIPAKGQFPDSLTNLITKLGERGYTLHTIEGNSTGAIRIGNKWWHGNLLIAVQEAIDYVDTH